MPSCERRAPSSAAGSAGCGQERWTRGRIRSRAARARPCQATPSPVTTGSARPAWWTTCFQWTRPSRHRNAQWDTWEIGWPAGSHTTCCPRPSPRMTAMSPAPALVPALTRKPSVPATVQVRALRPRAASWISSYPGPHWAVVVPVEVSEMAVAL